MPLYDIEDVQTGRKLTVEGNQPPTESDAEELFAAQTQPEISPKKKSLLAEMTEARKPPASLTLLENVGIPLLQGASDALSLSPKRILSGVEGGIEGLASSVTGSPKQLMVKPSLLMDKPLLPIPEIQTTKKTPVAGQIGAGAANAAIEFANFLQTPEFLAFLGVGGLPKTAQKAFSTAIAGQMLSHSPQQIGDAAAAAKDGDYSTASKLVTGTLGSTAIAALAAKHGLETPPKIKEPKPETQLEKGVAIEAKDHPKVAVEHPELLPEIAKDEIKLDPEAYKGEPVPTTQKVQAAMEKEAKGEVLTAEEKSAKTVSEQNNSREAFEKLAAEKGGTPLPENQVPTNQKYRVGTNPTLHTVVEKLPASKVEIANGEQPVKVKNEKTGEVTTVMESDLTPVKERTLEEKTSKKSVEEKLEELGIG